MLSCLFCSTDLSGRVSKRKFCSDKCRVYYYRENQRSLYNIYALESPLTGALFYIGCTKRPLDKRLKDHIRDAKQKRERLLSKKQSEIKGILDANQIPLIRSLYEFFDTEEIALSIEKEWIKKYENQGYVLFNLPMGGKREGAGRKKTDNPKEKVNFYIQSEIVKKLGGAEKIKNMLYDFIEAEYLKNKIEYKAAVQESYNSPKLDKSVQDEPPMFSNKSTERFNPEALMMKYVEERRDFASPEEYTDWLQRLNSDGRLSTRQKEQVKSTN